MSIGSRPIAAGPIAANRMFSGGSATVLSPSGAVISYTGYLPTATYTFPPDHVSQVTLEALTSGDSGLSTHLSSVTLEALSGGSASARTSSLAVEILRSVVVGNFIEAPLNGAATLTASINLIEVVNAALNGAGTLTATTVGVDLVDTQLNGVGTLTASATVEASGYNVVSSFTFEALSSGKANLAISSVTLEALSDGDADTILSSVTLEAVTSGDAAPKLSSVALEVLRSTGEIFYVYADEIRLSGVATLTADVVVIDKAIQAVLLGDSTFTASIEYVIGAAEALLTGTGTLSATVGKGYTASAHLKGVGTISATGGPLTFPVELIAFGIGTLRAKGKRVNPDGIENHSGYIHLPSLVRRDI
jgi:hypothetical protein